MSNMTPKELLRLVDDDIADLYHEWSEDNYCASWMNGGEEEFVEWIINHEPEKKTLSFHHKSTVKKIRELALERLR